MRKILVNDLTNIAEFMYDVAVDGCSDVSFVCLYADAVWVLKYLLGFDDITALSVEIVPEELCGYGKEYVITLDEDLNLLCEYAYGEKNYIPFWSDCVLVADDCNKEVLESVECDEVYLVAYKANTHKDDMPDCDGNCECCEFADENKSDDEDELVSESKSESSQISRTKDGRIAGFTKSWSDTDKDGITYYSSFSHYSDNEESVKKIARDFGINV